MPFFGKSGISRISFFKCSQLASVFSPLSPITKPLQCEMWSNLQLALLQLPERHPPALRAAPRGGVNATPATDHEYPWQALPRCCRDCCGPTRQCRAYEPRVLQTSESLRPELGREQRTFELGVPFQSMTLGFKVSRAQKFQGVKVFNNR